MKKLTTIFLSVMSTALLAQIPNASFETWTSGAPNGWKVVTSAIPGSVTQVSNAHQGSSAAQISSIAVGPAYYGGELASGSPTYFFLNSGNFVALNGWYILNANGGDELEIGVATKCPNDSANGAGVQFLSNNTAVYRQFSICMFYPKACTSDSASITFILFSFSGQTHSGSYAIVDDLSFGACTAGVNEINKDVTLEKAYPNPAGTTCNIIYSLPSDGLVNVALYDISGRKIENLLNDTHQTTGRYKIPVDVSSLSNGVYIYTITVDGQSYAQKLTVAR